MGRPPATAEQREHRRRRRSWSTRTEHKAMRALRRRHLPEFLRLLAEERAADPEPGKE